MKKLYLTLIACLSMFYTTQVYSQIAVGPETGPQLFAGSGSEFWWKVGGIFQYDINGTHSVGTALDFGIGDLNMLIINPYYRYAFDQTYDGPYIGGYFKYAPILESGLDGGSYFGFGATGGYEIPISDSFVLDINGQLGYASLGFDVGFGFGRVSTGGLDFGVGVAGKFTL